jgi:hypothetical protein
MDIEKGIWNIRNLLTSWTSPLSLQYRSTLEKLLETHIIPFALLSQAQTILYQTSYNIPSKLTPEQDELSNIFSNMKI